MSRPLRLPKLTRTTADWLGLFHSRVRRLDCGIGTCRIRAATRVQPPLGPFSVRALVAVGDGHLAIDLAGVTLDALVDDGFRDLALDSLPDALRIAALEMALDDPLAALEAALGVRAKLTTLALGDGPPLAPASVVFGLALSWSDGGSESPRLAALARIGLDAAGMALVADRLADRPPYSARGWDDVPVILPLEIGRTRIAIAEVRDIDTGDLVLLDQSNFSSLDAVLVPVHAGLTLRGHLDAGRLTITELCRPSEGGAAMSSDEADHWSHGPAAGTPHEGAVTDLDAIALTLSFDLGCVQLTFGEIKALAPGQILSVPAQSHRPVTIRANGQRIGRGELVEIDHRLGVRVLELFGAKDD